MKYAGRVLLASLVCASVACGPSEPSAGSICTPDRDKELEDCRFSDQIEGLFINDRKDVHRACNSKCRHAGYLQITAVPGLRNLKAFSQFETADALRIERNPDLETLDGLELTGTLNAMILDDNEQLQRIGDLGNVEKIDDLTMFTNQKLTDLSGLSEIREFEGIGLQGNAIESLKPLEGALVEKGLSITYENNLKSLDGLTFGDNLDSVGLQDNEALEDISALQDAGDIRVRLLIIKNSQLARCHIDETLGQMNTEDIAKVTVFGNGSGECD